MILREVASVVDLIAKTPCAGLLPVTIGTSELSEVHYPTITSAACFDGQARNVSQALKSSHGIAFPAPNRSTKTATARAVWIAENTAMICADTAPETHGAALTDQSDGWAVVRLSGPHSTDVLARLVPVDLRATTFKRDHCARTMMGHMNVAITRIDASTFEIMAFRSMAQTLVHEVTTAMRGIAARG
jgi:sarcosine oxidase subunit gamma